VVICAGSGGVGKTTIAAALGVRAVGLGLRTLVLTVDPAKRLATALGLSLDQKQTAMMPVAVPLSDDACRRGGTLNAAVLNSRLIFDQFILEHGGDSEAIARVLKNRLYQQLSTTLAGSQEFTALESLLQAYESEQYDLVVLDTPPTKHAVDFLTAPQRISSLFQDAVTRWFMNPSEQQGGLIANLVSRGTRAALKSLEKLTGSQFIEELFDFFSAIRSVQKVLHERSEKALRLLQGESTNFLVVTSFDNAKLIEANYLQNELKRLSYRMRAVVINRAFPLGIPSNVTMPPANFDHVVYEKVLAFYQKFNAYYAYRYHLYQDFSRGLDEGVKVVRIPEYQRDIYGLADLEALAGVLGEGGMA
jgi:anion-transporting  ArsA/GET3 family ATPase